jgi:hypothetical protein
MPEEVLRYRVEIDEASLQSELARARGSITNVLQTAVTTGQYAVNQVHADLALTRQTFALPEAVESSPIRELGFMQSALGVAGVAAPPNMLTSDFREMAQREFQSRIGEATFAVAREAMPIAAGLGAVGLSMGMRAGPIATLAAGAAAFVGTRALGDMGLGVMEQRQGAEELLSLTGAPHPMMPFTQPQRRELARGLVEDVAKDVRFGIEETGQLLAMGTAADMFGGTRSVDEFRTRFRAMLDQVKNITRVFQQSTEEAMQTLGQFNQMGVASPEVANARLGQVLSLSRMGGMAPQQALQVGMAGAQMAQAVGAPMGQGFDVMMQNAMRAETAEAAMAIDPNVARQLGGTAGIAAQMTQVGFQAAQAPIMRNLLAGLANESMTGLDQSAVRQFVSGQLSVDDLQQRAWNKMSDPAMQTRFASNMDLMQNQLAVSGLAIPAMYRVANERAQMMGAKPDDVFNMMMGQMGLNPMERQAALTFGRDSAQFDYIASRQREKDEMEIRMERLREEGRFTSRVGAIWEELRVGAGNLVGDPIRGAGEQAGGFLQSVVSLPAKAAEWLDLSLGKAIFGAPEVPKGMEQRTRSAAQTERAQSRLKSSIGLVTRGWDLDIKLYDKLDYEDFSKLEENAVAEFGPEIEDLLAEPDAMKRAEMRGKLREKMTGFFKTNYGHLATDDAEEATDFADKMLQVEKLGERNDNVRRGLQDIKKNASALQMRIYAGDEIPELLGAAVGRAQDIDQLTGIATQVAAGFRGGEVGSFEALRTLGEKAVPLLGRGTQIRERLEITQMAMQKGFLTPGDMMLDSKELGSIAEQSLTSEQARFVGALRKAADETEGKKVTAEQIFKMTGQGLGGGQYPSHTPQAGIDQTTQVLDRLTGAVNNLNTSSKELLRNLSDQNKRAAGK